MLVAKKPLKLVKITAGLFVLLLAVFLLANFVLAAGPDLGLNYAEGTGLSNAVDIRIIIARIIRIALGFLGIIAVCLIIYAGWLWLMSGGNEEKIGQAKAILKNAVIGLAIILSAFALASFVLNMLLNASGGGGNNQFGAGPVNGGISALGNGIIESHYPARGQQDVPRNTSIIVTFREAMELDTLCNSVDNTDPANPRCNGGEAQNVRIFKLLDQAACLAGTTGCSSLVGAKVYSSLNKKTFIFAPVNYLGSPSEYIDYAVYLTKDIKKANGDPAFSSLENGYEWSFTVSNKIDLIPPQVKSEGIFPAPDVSQDNSISAAAVPARGSITVKGQPASQKGATVAKPTVIAGESVSAIINSSCQQDGKLKVSLLDSVPLVAQLFSPIIPPATQGSLLGQGTFGRSSDNPSHQTITFSECNLVLTLNDSAANFAAGNGWNISATKAVAADTLTVGKTVYTFVAGAAGERQISVGATNADTAANIKDVLGGNKEITVTNSGSNLTITAEVAGAAGDNIELSTSNPSALVIAVMAGGTDRRETTTVVGRRDKPMNATVQIDFNEAIMPLTVSGTATEVANYIRVVNVGGVKKSGDTCAEDYECLSYKCESRQCVGNNEPKPAGQSCEHDGECLSYKCDSGQCVGNSLGGKFAISNQYTTVNFISDKECGFNSCGERIYCLPANSHLKVELQAASLAVCDPSDSANPNKDCVSRSPFNVCDSVKKVCRDASNHYYPQADLTKANIVDGVVDAAMNSLDGSRDNFAQGPASYYNENDLYGLCDNKQCSQADAATICGGATCERAKSLADAQKNGDSFSWSFFISDQMDITSPKITSTNPLYVAPPASANFNLSEPVLMHFDKLMMSSRLSTGSISVTNDQQTVVHRLVNLRSMAQAPLAYWVTSAGADIAPKDGEYEETDVYINHSDFSSSTGYQAQAGSGLEDVYQNCYMPCSSQTVNGTPSCCNGQPAAKESCP